MIPLEPEIATRLSVALATGPDALLDVLNGLLLDLPRVRTVTWLALSARGVRSHRRGRLVAAHLCRQAADRRQQPG